MRISCTLYVMTYLLYISHYYRKLYAVHVWTALLCIQYFMRLTYEFVCSFMYTIVFYTLTPFSFLFHLPPVRFLSSSLYAPFSSNSPLLPLPSPIPPFLYSSLHFLSSRPPPYPLLPFSTPSLSSPHRLHHFPLHSLSPPFPHSFLSFIFTPSPSLPPSPPLFDCFTSPPFSFLHCSSLSGTHSLTHLPPLSSV